MSEFTRIASLNVHDPSNSGLKKILNTTNKLNEEKVCKLSSENKVHHLNSHCKDMNSDLSIKNISKNNTKSHFYNEKKSVSDEKGLMSQQNFVIEKRVAKITKLRTSSRSSSAVKVKKINQSIGGPKGTNLKFKNLLAPTNDLINTLLYKNKDERYRYLIKNAKVHYIEKGTESIYVELPQIPNILIIYRKPEVRLKSKHALNLDDKGLNHIPLLEGEEKLVKLVLKRNKICKIENLVSLPFLETLDLSGNIIKELSNLNTCERLRSLCLRNNIIDSIQGLSLLKSLEVIDLSSNKIKKIEKLEKCLNLVKINLSYNFITTIEGLSNLSLLEDLDLSNNKITTVKDTRGLISIKKINLANNLIDSDLDRIKNLDRVQEFNIENNPASRKSEFMKYVKREMPKLVIFNNKKTFGSRDTSDKSFDLFAKPDLPAHSKSKKEGATNVIQIIRKEWQRELDRLKRNHRSFEEGKGKTSTDKCLVQSGHAEIEGNKMLFIYGNAMEVLKSTEFYPVVEEIYLECVRFDHIVHYSHLEKIKQFSCLKKLRLAHNNLNSLILMSKLECLHTLENLEIEDNEILNSKVTKSFIVYRFQHLKYYNSCKITPEDREDAKKNFHLFDNILSKCIRRATPSFSDPTKKLEFKQIQKRHAEVAKEYTEDILERVVSVHDKKEEIEDQCEYTLYRSISNAIEQDNIIV
ncbi:unnamed protein product [Moneuplotes crassus]|uniref:Uncharacterized protein n=1 Tax=Euplotes crassus TaxID=5936 RepID=A0AAD1U4G2_EUPCR|nr:unnamed protein product [Moneuplotes crassus]